MIRIAIVGLLGSLLLAGCASPPPPVASITLSEALSGPQRSAEHRARDRYRHPEETLEFFGLRPDMTVLEVWPGEAGWYAEILAPYLKAQGRYVAALYPDSADAPGYQKKGNAAFRARVAAEPAVFDRTIMTTIGAPTSWSPIPPGRADLVLTFRNVHNWMADDTVRDMFGAFYKALKPGGVLGVVEHRAEPYTPLAQQKASGYVDQELMIRFAEDAGLRFVGWQEFNANPADTKDYEKGVWTLPPVLALGEKDREKYLAIGESDRMTLKFVKPANP